MSVQYSTVQWNRQKRRYDRIMLVSIAVYLALFAALQLAFYPTVSPETLIIRATGTLALIMLHFILAIGPLSRIDSRFMPLLYNRRHLGVTLFLIAAVHGLFNIIQFHGLGNEDPLVSLFTSNTRYGSPGDFPFQVLGFFALLILFLMAATSHDFWLKNLHPKVWKSLHMMVYAAYALLILHVMLGVVQLDQSPLWIGLAGLSMATVIGLHLRAGRLEKAGQHHLENADQAGFFPVCTADEIPENRAKIALVDGQNIAIFRYDGKISAVSNICRHQHGPLGEGKVVDGCITCPWHGYQYLPHNGQSPPPYTEKLETYDVMIRDGMVWVNPQPYPEGTERPPALC
ncbi:MAG: ferric reductase-like transmembrane domain-containing protein [Lewinellaceae bacterium]|nr:ferric reductase-like transmembrane domain-containing protein [Lewinellaceae bacterium]